MLTLWSMLLSGKSGRVRYCSAGVMSSHTIAYPRPSTRKELGALLVLESAVPSLVSAHRVADR